MTRPEALSDCVLAIAMTVLVLDFRAPSHRDGTCCTCSSRSGRAA
jgi:uncharacterized membrane protein